MSPWVVVLHSVSSMKQNVIQALCAPVHNHIFPFFQFPISHALGHIRGSGRESKCCKTVNMVWNSKKMFLQHLWCSCRALLTESALLMHLLIHANSLWDTTIYLVISFKFTLWNSSAPFQWFKLSFPSVCWIHYLALKCIPCKGNHSAGDFKCGIRVYSQFLDLRPMASPL